MGNGSVNSCKEIKGRYIYLFQFGNILNAWAVEEIDQAAYAGLDFGEGMARILLADDDIELSDMLTDYLGKEGFEVEAAYDGNGALAKALANQYDLLILDVMMPNRNGFEYYANCACSPRFPC